MARRMSAKSLTMFASLAALGVTLNPAGAWAASLAVRVSPSIGHPVWLDLHDQIRYPPTQCPTTTDDPNTELNGCHPQAYVAPKSGHPKLKHRH
jgi:hypothetical protein